VKQHKVKKKALALSISCALALSLTPNFYSLAYAAETDSKQQENTEETAEYSLPAVTVEAKRPDWESKLSPGTVTIIRPSDYKGEQKTLPELLKDVPGVHVRYVAGKGQYTTVTVRGSTAAQVGVFVDGVLSNLGGDAAVDISTIPIHNVERIEVYRGYIPARFGGTYMGGVINIVTKRPDKANISASVGQSSWGGHTIGMEITQPLGKGSLMVGINRDESDGDFRYKSPGSDAAYAREMPGLQAQLAGQIDYMNNNLGSMGINTKFATLEEAKAAFNNPAVYNQYLSTASDNFYKSFGFSSKEELMKEFQWSGAEGEQLYRDAVKSPLDGVIPSVEKNTAGIKKQMSLLSKDSTRWRRNNDYKNTDAIIKWQDDHWMVKGSWKNIDRGMPQKMWLTGDINETIHTTVDMPNNVEGKRQELTTKDLLAGRRDTVGNLEWGWQVNYLDQAKRYRNPDYLKFHSLPMVFTEWSAFDSKRIGGAIDGTYKAGNNHLLEFMANWSKEKMDIDGNRMDTIDFISELPNGLRFRTYYEQTLFNLQLQDAITLNKAADLWLTPSIRYNYSEVMGRAKGHSSDGSIDGQHRWVKREDSQINDKVTWQMALKKKVDDNLTLRSTVGTYYRLLNLYEIAGDGAGIMPRPNTTTDPTTGNQILTSGSMFPVPEEGTQWDVSAIWDGKLLGANSSNVQLTYFGRNSENLLQLYRFGFDYWSYTNTAKGQVNGVELQGNFSWDKWDMNLATTYMKTKAQDKNDSPTGANTYQDRPHLYAPEWEGSVRLTYRPDQRTAIFTEVKYVDEVYCWQQHPENAQSALTTIGLGAKYKIDKELQVVVGVNDLFDKGPKMTFTSGTYDSSAQNKPIEYPLQGRTYYVTLQYKY
jgi:vitamin B12 transporter